MSVIEVLDFEDGFVVVIVGVCFDVKHIIVMLVGVVFWWLIKLLLFIVVVSIVVKVVVWFVVGVVIGVVVMIVVLFVVVEVGVLKKSTSSRWIMLLLT